MNPKAMSLVKKILLFLFLLALILLLASAAAWFFLSSKIQNSLDNLPKEHIVNLTKSEDAKIIIKYNNAELCGFPRTPSVCFFGLSEESKTGEVFYQKPVMVGYDFLLNELFVSYSGSLLSYFKPKSQGFGNRIELPSFKIWHKISLKKLLKIAKDKKVEFTNSDSIIFENKNVDIYDLINKEKVIQRPLEYLSLTCANQKIVFDLSKTENTNITALPETIDVDFKYELKNKNIATEKRNLPPILLTSFFNPSTNLEVYSQGTINGISLKKELLSKNQFAAHMTINVNGELIDLKNSKLDFDYKKSGYNQEINGSFSTKSTIHRNAISTVLSKNDKGGALEKNVIPSWYQKVDFGILEGKNYDVVVDFSLTKDKYNEKINLKEMKFAGEDQALKLSQISNRKVNDIGTMVKEGTYLTGNLSIQGAKKILDNIFLQLQNSPPFVYYPKETKEIYKKSINDILHIAANKYDETKDLLFIDYHIFASDSKNSKIGKLSPEEIISQYDSLVVKNFLNQTDSNDNIEKKIEEILPKSYRDNPEIRKVLSKIQKNNPKTKEHLDKLIKQIPKKFLQP